MNTFLLVVFFQIILESLPVSSSGHLVLFEKIFKFNFSEPIEYFLHGPTIIILISVFYKDWSFSIYKLFIGAKERLFIRNKYINHVNDFSFKRLLDVFFKVIKLVFISNLITILIWFIVKLFFEKQAWFSSDTTLMFGFLITMLFLFLLRLKCDSNDKGLNKNVYIKFIILGFVQGIALLPGISRFASVYVTSRLLNINKRRAFQITFLLELPLVVAGFLLGCYKITKISGWRNMFSWHMNIVILLATVISAFFLLLARRLVVNNKFWRFAFYMFIPISILFMFIV